MGGTSVGTDKLIVDAQDAIIGWLPAASLDAITATAPPSLTATSFHYCPQSVDRGFFLVHTLESGNHTVDLYSFEDTGGGSGYFTVAELRSRMEPSSRSVPAT